MQRNTQIMLHIKCMRICIENPRKFNKSIYGNVSFDFDDSNETKQCRKKQLKQQQKSNFMHLGLPFDPFEWQRRFCIA